MKAYINLLPREAPTPGRSGIKWIVMGIAILGGVVAAYSAMETRLGDLRKEVAALQGERNLLKGAWESAIGQAGAVARPVPLSGGRWADPLRDLTLSVPEGFYLNRMESVEPKGGEAAAPRKEQSLRLKGYAKTYGRLTDFMKRIDRSGTFGAPLLEFAGSEEMPGGERWIRFEILAPVTREEG